MSITYRELLKRIQALPDERLDDNVTVYDDSEDEYYPADSAFIQAETDVLDEGHLVLQIKDS